MGLRCAIVPPTPVPYREPLFRALSERPELELCVIYQSAGQPSWDVAPDWFPTEHAYPAVHLRSRQRRRAGRTPVLWSRGLERALRTVDPDCVVVSEYGPASLRALAWCRRHAKAYVIFSECTPQIDSMLPGWQLALHRRLARHADGLIVASSAARERVRAFDVPDERITVALQAADVKPFRAATPHNGNGPVKVISAGRLVPDKNFATLIEAVARTASAAELEIAGTGFLEDELKQLAGRRGVPVRFRGHVSPAEMPSRNAVLVDPGDVDAVARALGRLVSDPELRRRMAAESRAIDRETDGVEVDAFVAAVAGAAATRYSPSSAGSTSAAIRATDASGR